MSSSPEAQGNIRCVSPGTTPVDAIPVPTPNPPAAAELVGSKAAREAYLRPEVLRNILTMMDDGTLAVMLRLERGDIASIVAILYRKLDNLAWRHAILPTLRQDIYCSAVRTVDNSPRPQIRKVRRSPNDPIPRDRHDSEAVYMIPHTIHDSVAYWRGLFPNIHTILYRYPHRYDDDDYVIHLNGDKIIVELESFVHLDALYTPPTSKVRSVKFPKTPIYPGIEVRHTFALYLSKRLGPDFGQQDWGVLCGLWKAWLWDNPELDSRVTSIDTSAIGLYPSYEETIQFLAMRKANHCSPMTNVYLPPSPKNQIDGSAVVQTALSPSIRTLRLDEHALMQLCPGGTLCDAFAALDRILPSLAYLTIVFDRRAAERGERYPVFRRPLSGLFELRELKLEGFEWTEGAARAEEIFGGTGVRGCRFDIGCKEDIEGGSVEHVFRFRDRWQSPEPLNARGRLKRRR